MSSDSVPVQIVLTTFGSRDAALAFARTIVEERLAACVNVLPEMISTYRWQGRVDQEPEHQVVIKTAAHRLADLEARLRQLHPYDVPELLVLDTASASAAYGAWVADSVA